MGPRDRAILILLSCLVAAALGALVISRGSDQEHASPTSVGPPGWDVSRVPAAGPPLRQWEVAPGLFAQTLQDTEEPPVPHGRPVDIHYRAFTLDGAQQGRGVFSAVTLGAKNSLPGGVEAGLVKIRPFEKRRLFVPADMVTSAPGIRLPPNQQIVFDVHPVELVVTDVVEGTGAEVRLGQTVRVNYTGTLEDGTVFDDSARHGGPQSMTLRDRKLIQGWLVGIPGMRVGGTRRLWIPYHLAYGARSPGPSIPPYSNLIFEIELVDIER